MDELEFVKSLAAKSKSTIIESFLGALKESLLPECHYEIEYRFHHVRRWRLDVAFPLPKVGVEIDGFGYGHGSIAAKIGDAEKHRALVLDGWRILRYTTGCLNSKAKIKQAVEEVNELLCQPIDCAYSR